MTTCESCQRYNAAYGYCSMMGREVEPYEMVTAADCYWYESRKREVSKDTKACFGFSPRKQKDEGKKKH